MVGYGNVGNIGLGSMTDVVVYGLQGDGDAWLTAGYMDIGAIPQFYVNDIKANYLAANGDVLQNIPAFSSPSLTNGLSTSLLCRFTKFGERGRVWFICASSFFIASNSFGLYLDETSQSNGKYSNSANLLVPSSVITLSCFA